jgi:hypothetical protein
MTMPDTNHYPALTQLEVEFNEHMREFRDGIETAEDFVYWLQRCSVLTLGCIDDEVLSTLFTDAHAANAILLGQPAQKPRRNPEEEPLETDADAWYRTQVEASIFTPAFRRAYSGLKSNANEYIEEDAAGPDMDAPPALRPAIEELSTRQREVLDALFQDDGFSDEARLSEWSRDVVAATRGYAPDAMLKEMTVQTKGPFLHRTLLRTQNLNQAVRRNYLHTFAARFLLPLFNRAVGDLSRTAGEQADDQPSSTTDTLGV